MKREVKPIGHTGHMAPPPPHNPYMQSPKRPWYKKWWAWLLIVLGTLLLAAMLFVAFSVALTANTHQAAEEQCREEVINQAKYPGGVQFVDDPVIESDAITNDRGNTILALTGEADYPNGFGTPVRMKYVCFAESTGSEILQTSAIVSEKNPS